MTVQAKNFENGVRSAESTVIELNRIVAQAEELLKTLGEEGGAAVEAVRQRVLRTVSQAKVKLADTAEVTDKYVHNNPWRAIAYGAAAGAAVALIAAAIVRRD